MTQVRDTAYSIGGYLFICQVKGGENLTFSLHKSEYNDILRKVINVSTPTTCSQNVSKFFQLDDTFFAISR